MNKPEVASKWVQQLPSLTAILNKELELIDASTAWFTLFGLNRKDSLGKDIFKLFPRFSEDWKDSFDYALDGLNDIKMMDSIEPAGQEPQDFEWLINPWKDGYGNSIGIIMNIKDVAGTNVLEKKLKQTENLLKDKGATAKIGSWEYKVEEADMYWSNELREILEAPKDFGASLDAYLAFFKENQVQTTVKDAIREAMVSGKPWNLDVEITTQKGKTKSANIIGRPKFKNGKCSRIIGTVQDISETPRQKKKIREENFTNFDFFDNVPHGLALINPENGRIEDLNLHLRSILDIKKLDFLQKSFKSFVTIKKCDLSSIKKSLMTHFHFRNIRVALSKELKKPLVFEASGNLINIAGNKKRLLVSLKDVTFKNGVIEEYAKKLERLESDLEKIVYFSHTTSHNLKAHATNFDLLLNFLSTETAQKEKDDILHMLFKSVENLSSTIKGLRDMVSIRYEANSKKEVVPLNDYIYRIQENHTILKKHKVKILNEVPEDTMVYAIPSYLENILGHLVLNAIRLRHPKKPPIISLRASTEEGYTVVCIEDNGAGVALSKERDKVLAFYKKLRNHHDSSGIGLYLVKYQVDLLGGKITVESAPNEGSCFKLYFPMPKKG